MKTLISQGLRFDGSRLLVLDQTRLPHEEIWIVCESPDHMVHIIQHLQVRGAPLIGISAALSLAHFVEQGATHEQIMLAAQKLKTARPTAVNLAYCINTQLEAYGSDHNQQKIIETAQALFETDIELSEAMSNFGAELIQNGENILTHCNTGCLVTTGIGTALGVVYKAHEQGKNIHVYVDETRPLLQGARLTTWELTRANIPHTLICDNMAASLMKAGKIQRVLVGADRIAANGDTANKIGTYNLAVLAYYHQIPFHIVAPETTIDMSCATGDDIVIELRKADEVRGTAATPTSPVYNPAFDVTPAKLITSHITNKRQKCPEGYRQQIQ